MRRAADVPEALGRFAQPLQAHGTQAAGRCQLHVAPAAVVALATDPDVMQKSGQLVEAADLAREYGFADIDGRQVPPFRELFPELFQD